MIMIIGDLGFDTKINCNDNSDNSCDNDNLLVSFIDDNSSNRTRSLLSQHNGHVIIILLIYLLLLYSLL